MKGKLGFDLGLQNLKRRETNMDVHIHANLEIREALVEPEE